MMSRQIAKFGFVISAAPGRDNNCGLFHNAFQSFVAAATMLSRLGSVAA